MLRRVVGGFQDISRRFRYSSSSSDVRRLVFLKTVDTLRMTRLAAGTTMGTYTPSELAGKNFRKSHDFDHAFARFKIANCF